MKNYFILIIVACFLLLSGTDALAQTDQNTWFFRDMNSANEAVKSGKMVTDLNNLIHSAITNMGALGKKMFEFLRPESKAIFIALLFPILVAEISFTGIRIMMRAPIVEQLTRLTVATFILVIIYTGKPTTVIAKAKDGMATAGAAIGASLIKHCRHENDYQTKSAFDRGDVEMAEPVAYWFNWIGISNAADKPVEGAVLDPQKPVYKFSSPFLYARIWGTQNSSPSLTRQEADGATPDPLVESLTKIFLPIQTFMMAITIAGIQVSGLMAAVFAAMSIRVGAEFTFYVALLLGFATLPLMYFTSFNKIWAQYLTTLTGLALVPFFYYLFSAVGFVFVTNLFEMLFPGTSLNGGEARSSSLAELLNAVFLNGINSVYSSGNSYMDAALGGTNSVMMSIIAVFLNIGRIGLASTIVTAFIFGGVSFSTLAINAAFRWNQAFASEEMLGKINEFFSGLQSSIGTGLGSMYGDGMQRAAGMGGGLLNGIRGRMK